MALAIIPTSLLRSLFLVSAAVIFSLVLTVVVTWFFTNFRYYLGLRFNRSTPGKTITPVKIPYAVPWLGHGLQFLTTKPGSFWTRLFEWHSRDTGACTLTLGGRSWHVLYNKHAFEALFKARDPHRNHTTVDVIVKALGVEPSEARRYYAFGEPVAKEFGRTPRAEQERIHQDYLLKTDRVNEITAEYIRVLKGTLASELRDEGETLEIGLYTWLRSRLFRASTTAIFGTTCLEDCPNLEEDFFQFDQGFLTCYFGVPRWFAPQAYGSRERLTTSFVQHQLRNLERTKGKIVDADGSTAWEPIEGGRLNRARQNYYRARGLSVRSGAIMDIGFLFGLSSNAIPAAGWMLAHILDPNGDSTLLPRVMRMVRASQRNDGTFDIAVLVNQPLLLSMLHEVLRLYVDALVVREFPKDIILPIGPDGEKIFLEKGSQTFVPSWIGHRDGSVWEEPDKFCAERWLSIDSDTGEEVFSTRGAAGKFFPFGGGKTICPGRIFAKQEILGSVALVLSEFEFEGIGYSDGKGEDFESFPLLRKTFPGSAIMVMDGDVKVRIRRR